LKLNISGPIFEEYSRLELNFEITSLGMTSDASLVCVCLLDEPLYSMLIVDARSNLTRLESRSLLSVLEYETYLNVLENSEMAMKIVGSEDAVMESGKIESQHLYSAIQFLNQDLFCAAGRSIKILTSKVKTSGQSLSFIIVTFGDGRTLTMSLDHTRALSQNSFNSSLEFICRKEADLISKESSLSDYQILSIGTIEPTLKSFSSIINSVMVCCDRPTVFYLEGDRLEMQYLRENGVN